MMRDISFTTTDGLALHAWTRWPAASPARSPAALIAHVHGMGEHSGRYDHLTAYWAERGYASAGFDLRGHGRSEGRRGHTPDYERLMEDIAQYLARVAEDARAIGAAAPGNDVPLVLYGHSLGGNLVLNYVIRRNRSPTASAPASVPASAAAPATMPALSCAIASSPYLRLAFAPPAWKIRLAHAVRRIMPAFSQSTALDTHGLSRDPAVAERLKADPLVHTRITASFFLSVHEAGESIIARAAELSIPTLVMHGSADPITSALASEAFVASSGGKASLKIWDGCLHEVHNEPCWPELADFVLFWIARHTAAARDGL